MAVFEADTDISAIRGPIYRPIPIFPKFLKSSFLLHYQKYDVFYALPFFKNWKIRIYKLEFLKLQQFQYLIRIC